MIITKFFAKRPPFIGRGQGGLVMSTIFDRVDFIQGLFNALTEYFFLSSSNSIEQLKTQLFVFHRNMNKKQGKKFKLIQLLLLK
ncbi:hypothetical protein SAMN04487891_113102 [Flagellimonas taeanensis]|uniref:Uncharacterized protein n=1 Tax=Flagellimonas taeanensis TaxID=1005926 RepID=A0A1M6UKZ7_9FLAO|nr:hypothetical protein SAMN04487891_113102 [Allomuricauda taeanensis]SHK69810.1 hypothetical protein SAMN05216293_1664 [Allomuricauda taeanensis]